MYALTRYGAMEAMLAKWFETEQGRYVRDWELAEVDRAVEDVFGYHALQIGLPHIDYFRENRISHKACIGLEAAAEVRASACELPVASNSVDLVVLPHVLEFSAEPHRILREAERVLMPEGSIVITGFNPWSMWGARFALSGNSTGLPRGGRLIGMSRLRDWLKLLSFEHNGGGFGC